MCKLRSKLHTVHGALDLHHEDGAATAQEPRSLELLRGGGWSCLRADAYEQKLELLVALQTCKQPPCTARTGGMRGAPYLTHTRQHEQRP